MHCCLHGGCMAGQCMACRTWAAGPLRWRARQLHGKLPYNSYQHFTNMHSRRLTMDMKPGDSLLFHYSGGARLAASLAVLVLWV